LQRLAPLAAPLYIFLLSNRGRSVTAAVRKDGTMSYVITQPERLPAAAQDMAGIGSTISEARAAAAGATTGVVAAAVAKAATLPGGVNFGNI
jgi:hypothetical protein